MVATKSITNPTNPAPVDPFASPTGLVKIADYANRLLLIKPLRVREGIPTSIGEGDAIECNVVVLDDLTAGQEGEYLEHDNVLIFQKVLKASLVNAIGNPRYPYGVLGRLETRKASKKGYNDAWVLADHTDDDKVLARAYIKWAQERLKTLDPFAGPNASGS